MSEPVRTRSDSVSEIQDHPALARSPLFASLGKDDQDTLLRTGSAVQLGAGDPISTRHAPDDALHVLLEGAAVERSWSSGGDESFIRPIASGETIGLTDVLTARASMARETRTLVRSLTLRLPGASVRGLLRASQPVAAAIARVGAHALHGAELDRLVLGTGDAMTRVTYRIVELALGWGRAGEQGVHIDLPLTQEQLGSWAGVSRETTVKCLHWLRGQRLISTSRRRIVVHDLPTLEGLARQRGAAPIRRRRTTRHPRSGPY